MEYKQALIITDSLGAPRTIPPTSYQSTWVSQVEDFLWERYQIKTFAYTEQGLTSEMALKQIQKQLQHYNPSLVILQFGIVDCSPRIIKMKEFAYLDSLVPDFLLNRYNRMKRFILVDPLFRNLKRRYETSPIVFRSNVDQMLNDYFKEAHIYFVPIGWPNKRYFLEAALVRKRVEEFNEILKEFSGERYHYLQTIEDIVRHNIYQIYHKRNRHYLLEGHHRVASLIQEQIADTFTSEALKPTALIRNASLDTAIHNWLTKQIAGKPRYVYGTGRYAYALINHLNAMGQPVHALICQDGEEDGKVNGVERIRETQFINQVSKMGSSAVIFTGTATPEVENDISTRLKSRLPKQVRLVQTYSQLRKKTLFIRY